MDNNAGKELKRVSWLTLDEKRRDKIKVWPGGAWYITSLLSKSSNRRNLNSPETGLLDMDILTGELERPLTDPSGEVAAPSETGLRERCLPKDELEEM